MNNINISIVTRMIDGPSAHLRSDVTTDLHK